jgi:hypothetical protein
MERQFFRICQQTKQFAPSWIGNGVKNIPLLTFSRLKSLPPHHYSLLIIPKNDTD